jgi:hypothetical protein
VLGPYLTEIMGDDCLNQRPNSFLHFVSAKLRKDKHFPYKNYNLLSLYLIFFCIIFSRFEEKKHYTIYQSTIRIPQKSHATNHKKNKNYTIYQSTIKISQKSHATTEKSSKYTL